MCQSKRSLNRFMKALLKLVKSAAKPNLPGRIEQLILRRIIASPQLAAKFYPYEGSRRSYILPKVGHECPKNESDLPIPPQELWLGYGKTPEEYLATGRDRIRNMKEILEASGFSLGQGSRVLDFGSASGIMMRWLYDITRAGEVWGVDILGDWVVWCQQHLSPPFKFVTTTSYPHLPFEDRYFDLIYAGSVFTHISDLAEAWLLELKRIVRPGGRLYLTVHDNTTIRKLLTDDRPPEERHPAAPILQSFEQETHFTASDFAMFAINRAPGPGAPGQAQVFYDIDYLQQHWGNYLEIISIHPEAYGHQTAILMKKYM
jgi:ubiquinone/menaquinone biosynthesis C-methylase UbiE